MPDRTIRTQLVEAGADELRACISENELLEQFSPRILDAMLDTLAENTDEWTRELLPNAHPMVRSMYRLNADRLLAVLREGDEG